jgi:hypothetical protein
MAEKKSDKPEPAKKVAAKMFDDVKRPEETLASATSKPVIVGHTNIIKDPMVSTAEPTSEGEPEEKEVLAEKPKHELKLQPISAEETVLEADTETPAEDASQDEIAETENQDELNQPETSNAAVDAIVDTINTKKDRDEDTEKQQLIDSEVNDLINSRQYNVKIRPAPSKRKKQLIMLLVLVALLGVAGWYLGVGPGKDIWLGNDTVSEQTSAPSLSTATAESTAQKSPEAPQLLAFTNNTIKTTFSYPKTWKIEVVKDSQYPTIDVITITSPVEQVDSITKDTPAVKAEVFMRTKIYVENTKDLTEYASDLTKLTTCVSEDIVIGNSNLKLLFVDSSNQSPNVSQLSIGTSVCNPSAGLFNANDQVQLSTKQNTYVIYTEYVFSTDYLKKNGTDDEAGIKLAQESGIVTSKDAFKATNSYKEFIEIIKSLKEL